MLLKVAKHLVSSLELLDETQVLSLTCGTLPALHCTPNSLEVVVLAEGNSEFLTSDEVVEELFTLEGQGVNRVTHASESRLSGTDEVLIRNDLINQLLLGETLELVLSISHVILPLAEIGGQWMVHPIDDLSCTLLSGLSLSHKCLELVEGLRHDREVTILEEERDDSLLHV